MSIMKANKSTDTIAGIEILVIILNEISELEPLGELKSGMDRSR
jgi:hypothetical protein